MAHDVKVNGATVVKYPYNRYVDLKNDYPTKRLPKFIADEVAASYGVYPVTVAAKPANTAGKVVTRSAEPTLIGGEWVIGWDVRDRTTEEDDALRQSLFATLGNIRWQKETGGILSNGVFVATDSESRGKITSTVVVLDKDMVTGTIRFKFAPGAFGTVTKLELEAISAEIAQHVQACFDAESDVTDLIIAASSVELDDFDVQAAFDAALVANS